MRASEGKGWGEGEEKEWRGGEGLLHWLWGMDALTRYQISENFQEVRESASLVPVILLFWRGLV